jgi:putative endonuclease
MGRCGKPESRQIADPATGDWSVYIAACADGSLYTGIARDLPARMAAHNAGTGARYTRGRRPVALVYSEAAADRSAASRRESALKRLTRAAKLALIAGSNR